MLYSGINDKTNFKSERYISINSCNIQHSGGRSYTVLRKEGRLDYHILYISEGKCKCFYENDERLLGKGEFVIYPPGTRQKYTFGEGEEVTTLWIHFSGTGIEELFSELGLCGGFFRAILPMEAEHYFRRIINLGNFNTPSHKICAEGYLLNLLSSLSTKKSEYDSTVYSDAVSKITEYIGLNWQKHISVGDLARLVRLSESRTAHLFKEATGKSIHQYISEKKIQNAKELLANTDMTVSEISTTVGYDDALYFSKVFRREVGVSPKNFKNHLKNKLND